ncbi:HET-domain-containing protein [Melanomma pulvis-pyrius CBS 109.77]|uniref:HET-domain-containing protein n=1 Tax=Melanomma pulvis-pyrius CBS 109.77 TaxID=1314802 RepID=A0A6A6WPG8_9PLEO|nr:HET-domain-containing protein [Melanomma pulvis-pyrius CBS 109.77]
MAATNLNAFGGVGKYVALSHCWGKITEDNKRQFCTTDNNIKARLVGFNLSELPKTFQDAIHVTRELGIQYLWIDSLCIKQWNEEDWDHEAKRIESVFSSAYCTIAATSAIDSNAGFLNQNGSSAYVHAQNASGQRFYICANIDNFDNDVENARLNTRAWVLQERLLAQRTIHFSANQIYWECGKGIYCESLSRLESRGKKNYFTLDPDFPSRLLKSNDYYITDFLHFLFEDYSKRDLTVETDRCVAMYGLETRIADALHCQSRYGIFQRYLHGDLLWQASKRKMERIACQWNVNLEFDEERKVALITDVGKFLSCIMELGEKHYDLLDFSRVKRGWIKYDVEKGEDLHEERCVVVGRKFKNDEGEDEIEDEDELPVQEYYMLVVRPTGLDGEYKRVGIGQIQSDYVVKERLNVRIV